MRLPTLLFSEHQLLLFYCLSPTFRTEVAVAYMDEGSAPLTDSTGRPVKFATLSVTAPGPDGQHTTLAIASVPAGYDIEAGAIQEALSNSLATGKGQSVLPYPRARSCWGLCPRSTAAHSPHGRRMRGRCGRAR